MSVYERREFSWRDRRLVGHEDRAIGRELIVEDGEPVSSSPAASWSATGARDGRVLKFPERPWRPEELDREPDTEWVFLLA